MTMHRSITRPRRKRERGIALVIILVLMTVMMAMGIVLSKDARTELRISRDEKLAKQAIATAEAGISHAFDVVKQAPIDLNSNLGSGGTGGSLSGLGSVVTLSGVSYRFHALGALSGDGYYVRVVDNSDETIGANDPTRDTDKSIWLVSVGRAGNAQRRVDALLHVGGIPGGIFGDLSVGFGGSGGLIDSYDSRVGPYNAASPGSHGDVGSNGGILLQSANVDHGNATAGGTVSCSASCATQVTGTLTNGAPPVALVPNPYPTCSPLTDGTGISGGIYYGATGKKAGQLVGGSGDNIVFTPGTYCLNTVTISGGGLLTVNGPVVIIVNGQSSFGGGGVVNTTALASNLQILSAYVNPKAGLTINGGSQAYMQVYAPGSEVVLGGGTDFYGSLVAGSISSTGGSRVHRDEALGSPINGGTSLSAWHEVRN